MADEHKRSFFTKLHAFHRERGEDTDPPTFAKRAVDQYKLWIAVQEAGGHAEVTVSKGWARIGRLFDPPKTMTDLSFRIKKIYETNLLPFEKAVNAGSIQGVYIPPRAAPQATPAAPKPSRPKPPKRASTEKQPSATKRSRRENTDEMVGKRIRVLWPDERQFFSGTVAAYDAAIGLHRIEYDDGDEEMLDLATQTWHLLTDIQAGGEGLELFDNGGLGRLHSAAEALALGQEGRKARRSAQPDEDGCVIRGDGYKVYQTQDASGFEAFCLIPGLGIQDIRVQCWDSGKLLVSGRPSDEAEATAWGLRAVRHKIRLPARVDARSAKALLTLHGHLYIRVPCESTPPVADTAADATAAATEDEAPEATGEAGRDGTPMESKEGDAALGVVGGTPSGAAPVKDNADRPGVLSGDGAAGGVTQTSHPAVSGAGAPSALPSAVLEPAHA